MVSISADVVRHYSHGALEDAVRGGLLKMGRSPDTVEIDDLAPVDEFHTGGRQATVELAEQMELRPEMSVLDIGSGIGGAARFLARRYGCSVTGIDLTPEYVAVARTLTALVGLTDRVAFRVGEATELPVENGSFEAATLLHVGMNIADKARLCTEVARVLKPGGTFAIYDVMRMDGGDLDFPVPWASRAEMSFVAEPTTYRRALEAAGFEILAERNRRAFALDFFRRMKAQLAETGPPPLGLHVLMGAEAQTKVGNVITNIDRNRIAPVEVIARRR